MTKKTKEPKDSAHEEETVKGKAEEAAKTEETGENETPKKENKKTKEDEIEEMGQKLQEMNDKYLRLSAEFDNYRKRTLKEKMDLTKSANEKILLDIIPVVDDLERAIGSIATAKDIDAVKQGVDLIYFKFKDFMINKGIKEIDALNADFDTDVHEALTKIPAPEEKLKGKVVDVIEKGYTLNDKVIRFAKVVVGE